MTELINLKNEARQLLAQVNQHVETSPTGRRITYSPWQNEHAYNEMSFKERVSTLREKYYNLSSQTALRKYE